MATRCESTSISTDTSCDTVNGEQWTATRCHRLLRRLESRLATLRKLVQGTETQPASANSGIKRPVTDDYAAQQPVKRIRYTYKPSKSRANERFSSSSAQKPTTSTTPTRPVRHSKVLKVCPVSPATNFPTPIKPMVRKKRNKPLSSQTDASLSLDRPRMNGLPREVAEGMRSLRNVYPEGHFRICVAILEWLGNLLHITNTHGREGEPHPKSLLAMCLRKVPACIDDIEAWEREKENSGNKASKSTVSTSDISLDMYMQLEAMGGRPGIGWMPIKQTVRAHAMSHLRKALAEGLFHPEYVVLIVRLCISLDYVNEATAIATAPRGTFPDPVNRRSCFGDNSRTQPLQLLVSRLELELDGQGSSGNGIVFNCMAQLVREKRLSSSWLLSKGLSVAISSGLLTLSANGGNVGYRHAILGFLSTAIESLCCKRGNKTWGKRGDRQDRCLVSVVAGLTVAASNSAFGCGSKTAQSLDVWRVIFHVLDSTVNRMRHYGRMPVRVGRSEMLIPVLARYLAVTGAEWLDHRFRLQAGRDLEELLPATLPEDQPQEQQAKLLACSIAQGLSQSQGHTAHECFSKLCSHIDELSLPVWFKRGLRIDGASMLAQKTKDAADLAFAERQAKWATTPSKMKQMEQVRLNLSGWKWEEGISEWVISNPGSKIKISPRPSPKETVSMGCTRAVSAANKCMASVASSRPLVKPQMHGRTGRMKETKGPVFKNENMEFHTSPSGILGGKQCTLFRGIEGSENEHDGKYKEEKKDKNNDLCDAKIVESRGNTFKLTQSPSILRDSGHDGNAGLQIEVQWMTKGEVSKLKKLSKVSSYKYDDDKENMSKSRDIIKQKNTTMGSKSNSDSLIGSVKSVATANGNHRNSQKHDPMQGNRHNNPQKQRQRGQGKLLIVRGRSSFGRSNSDWTRSHHDCPTSLSADSDWDDLA